MFFTTAFKGAASAPTSGSDDQELQSTSTTRPNTRGQLRFVLSLLTGYVSAQFHLKHDDFFETVRDLSALPQSKWQELARFTP